MKLDKKYDICFGIGEAYMCSLSLRRAGLQFASYPFDWIGINNPHKCVELLTTSFEDFLERKNFIYDDKLPENGFGRYRNCLTDFVHALEFPDRLEIDDESYRCFYDKYSRRIARLAEHLAKSKRVLMVCVCLPDTPKRGVAEFQKIRATMLAKYPHLELDLLVFQYEEAIPFSEECLVNIAQGVYEARFEYRHPNGIDASKVSSALKNLGIKAVDYRSHMEKKAYQRKKTELKYAKYGAKTYLCYAFRHYLFDERKVIFFIKAILPVLRRKRYDDIISLGGNCEIAFRQSVAWGAVESSLFNWGVTGSIVKFIERLQHFDDIFNGEIELWKRTLWQCMLTGLTAHGKLQLDPNKKMPSTEALSADREDLRGRMKYLKSKFLKRISGEGKTLFVRRLLDADLSSPTFKEDLITLNDTLVKLGARNHEYLLVVEKKNRKKVPKLKRFHVRTVKEFNPVCDVANVTLGDFDGWNLIFTEFVQTNPPIKKHDYKFEKH